MERKDKIEDGFVVVGGVVRRCGSAKKVWFRRRLGWRGLREKKEQKSNIPVWAAKESHVGKYVLSPLPSFLPERSDQALPD